MTEHNRFSYENSGTSSYLTAAFPSEAELIHYQLEMLTSNEIEHLLPVSKRMINGETILYYNISSRTALNRILDRRKLKREELLHILSGIVKAGRDAAEFQLSLSGMVMDAEYIFVDPADCSPYFVYLPIAVNEMPGAGVKNFILNLIMSGKLELSGDNFVQVLLETVNQEPFSLDRLDECVKKAGGNQAKPMQAAQIQNIPPQGGMPQNFRPQPISSAVPIPQAAPSMPAQPPIPNAAPAFSEEITQADAGAGGKPQPPKSGKFGRKPKEAKEPKRSAKAKAKKEKPVKTAVPVSENDTGFDAEKAKKKFMLPQAVIMVAAAALVSFGAFVNPETGGIEVTNILAAVILIGVIEVILYREAYVNSKNPKEKKNAKASGKKESKKGRTPNVPLPGKGRPSVPGSSMQDLQNQAGNAAQQTPSFQPMQQPAAPQAQTFQSIPKPVQPFQPAQGMQSIPQPQPIPQPVPIQPIHAASPSYDGTADTYFSDETEILSGGQSDLASYLEYYENGIMTRVPLNKPSVLVGRLKNQVDFAVANPKVGKIHAEFLVQDGMIYVKDLNSRNGTYINGNGQRISSNVPYPLNDKDRITLADSDFTLRCSIR